MQMANLNNSMERTLADWEKIVSSADSRLQIRMVKNPVGSAQAIVVIEFV